MPSRALLTEVQTIPNADIVQALGNLKITATSGKAKIARAADDRTRKVTLPQGQAVTLEIVLP